MIRLTRLSGEEFVVNAEYIKFLEQTPDTIVTLRDGEKFLVKEEPDEVIGRVMEYARSIRLLPELG